MPDKNNTLEKLQLEMKDTLEGLGMIEVVSASSRNGDIRFLCRVHDEKAWLQILAEFLACEGSWYSFIGKKYFTSKRGGLVFGWVLIFESQELDATVQEIRRNFLSAYSVLDTGSLNAGTSDADDKPIPGGGMPFGIDYDKRFGNKVRAVK